MIRREIRRSVFYPHPREVVWRALTDRDALAAWLMPNDFEPTLGHRFEFRTKPAPGFDGIVRCEVLELAPPRRMVWSWRGGQLDTRVTFELEEVARGTELRLTHSGFEGAAPALVSVILSRGWASMFRGTLAEVLDRIARGATLDGVRAAAKARSAKLARTIRIETRVDHPPPVVWRALTKGPTLGRWLMPTDLDEARLGEAFTFRMKPQAGWDGVTHCEVLELDPQRRIALAYRSRATGEKTLACAGVESEEVKRLGRSIFSELDTVLAFTIEPAPDGKTRLVLEHSGFRGLKLVAVSAVLEMGWRRVLRRLPPVLRDLS